MTAPPPPPATDPIAGRVLDGRYRIESLVARGGMATVYRGADLRLDRTVAIKVMHPSFASDPGFVERFQREARAAARLNSSHVVAVHDQGNDGGVIYLVMEYVPGHTVRDILRTHGPLQPAKALAIIDPVLEALAAAHRAGYIHRDVKPENVLISDDGRVKVTDFGLARAIEGTDSGKTHGLLLGTVAYLSPEQVDHDRTDARSDVYGAGILLFELVSGQVPYSAAAPMQVAYKHVHEDVPAPSSVRSGIPPEVDALVHRATRRNPNERFPDADAFLHEVRALRASLPPAEPWAPTPHDTLVVRAGRGEQAHAVPAGVAGAAVVAAAVGHTGPDASLGSSAVGGAVATGAEEFDAATLVTPLPGPSGTAGTMATSDDAVQVSGGAVEIEEDEVVHSTEVAHRTASDDAPPPRRGRRGIWLGLIAVLSLAGVLALVWSQRVPVPDVVGMTPAEATFELAKSNLKLDAEQTDYSEDYPKGEIISTDPGPGGSVWSWSGGTVVAVVSMGPERYDVPNLKGLTAEEASVALGAVKLVLGEQVEVFDDKVKEGRIVSSDPKAGESVKPETVVTVEVSKGPAPVDLPALEGTNGDDAQKALKDLGLKVDRSDVTSESVPAGVVISMDPAGGTTVFRGDTVELVVSTGPPLVKVPNVVGRSEDKARDELTKAGFQVRVNYPLGFNLLDRVRTQSPKGGQSIPKGSTVQVDVV